jgi:hypothetical protein
MNVSATLEPKRDFPREKWFADYAKRQKDAPKIPDHKNESPKAEWFIAHDPGGPAHCGRLDSGQCVATGLAALEIFSVEDEFNARKKELAITTEENENGAEK